MLNVECSLELSGLKYINYKDYYGSWWSLYI